MTITTLACVCRLSCDCARRRASDSCREPRLDVSGAVSPGFNLRYANFYTSADGHTQLRDVFKAYGVRIIVTQSGRAGRFSIVNLFVNIGALSGGSFVGLPAD